MTNIMDIQAAYGWRIGSVYADRMTCVPISNAKSTYINDHISALHNVYASFTHTFLPGYDQGMKNNGPI